MFVDRVKIQVDAGKGGDGCLSFRREKFVPHGGPDGGDGGNGGSVIIVAREGVNNLAALTHRYHWRADSGQAGSGSNRYGRGAEDMILHVPPGTVVIDAVAGFVIRDLAHDGDQVDCGPGGPRRQRKPAFQKLGQSRRAQWTKGQEGESRELVLELKVIADVGLIGKPNAGKSTLLSRLSHARPQIAAYPFTTKYPNLGQVQLDAERSFVLADLPGLIEGAHEGAGLGHEFLRHIERAGILVHLVEPCPARRYRSADKLCDDSQRIVAARRAARPAARDRGGVEGRIARRRGSAAQQVSAHRPRSSEHVGRNRIRFGQTAERDHAQ